VVLALAPAQPAVEACKLLPLQAQPRKVVTEIGQEDYAVGERWQQQVGRQWVVQAEQGAPFHRRSSWVVHPVRVHPKLDPNLQGH